MNKILNKSYRTIYHLLILLAFISSTLAPLIPAKTAHAANTKSAQIGMPFTGKWAYNAHVDPPYVDSCPNGQQTCSGLSSHPSVHHRPGGGDWSTDLYAAENMPVRLRVGSASGNVTYSWRGVGGTCGGSTGINVFVDGVQVGWLYFTHLKNVVTSGPITNGMTLGHMHNLPHCAPGPHIHMEFKNTQSNFSCYYDKGNPGVQVGDGSPIGLLGANNTGPQQACSGGQPGGGGASSVVFTNSGGATFATNDPVNNPWTQLSNSTKDISASGAYTAWIDGCGAAWATSDFVSMPATQLTACNGATAITIGSMGNVGFIDGCGRAWATNTYTNSQSWVMLTGCNGATAIEAGGGQSGQMAFINSCGALNVTVNYQNWTQVAPCNGARSVAIGPTGTVAFINGCGALSVTQNYTNPSGWTQITGCNGATKLAVGSDRSLVFANGCGGVHATDTYDVPNSWVMLTGCNGAREIAMGTNGDVGIINGCGALNVTANFQNWTQIAPCNGALRIARG